MKNSFFITEWITLTSLFIIHLTNQKKKAHAKAPFFFAPDLIYKSKPSFFLCHSIQLRMQELHHRYFQSESTAMPSIISANASR